MSYEKIIHENPDKGVQLRLVLSEFKDTEYLHIRKYYMSYDEGYLPTKEGVSMPATLSNVFSLLDGIVEICANREYSEAIKEHFKIILKELDNGQDKTVSN